MAERRGFQYALAPVQRKCDWDLQDVLLALGELNQAEAAAGQRLGALREQVQQVRADWTRQLQQGQLNLELQRLTHAFLGQLAQRIAALQAHMTRLRQRRDQVLEQAQALRRLADQLARHRSEALRGHERAVAEAGYRAADDIWLQRSHWRKRA
jgi:chromosome segregation ATPase